MRRTPGREDPDGDVMKPLKFSIGSDDDDTAPVDASHPPPRRYYPGDSHTAPTMTHMRIIRWLVRWFPRLVMALVMGAFITAMLPGGWRVALCAANIVPPPSLWRGENVTLIAHRGCEFPFPENTAKALRYGAELVGFVELDLSVTKDGEVVAMHDTTLDRTTNGTGVTCTKTVEYIKNLVVKMPTRDSRGKISQARFCMNVSPSGQSVPCLYRVPTLREVFDYLPKGTKYMLDLKECATPGVKAATPLCSNCTALLQATKKAMASNFISPNQITFTSTESAVLKLFQDNMPPGSSYSLGMGQQYSHYKRNAVMQMILEEKFNSASFYIGLAAVRPDLVHLLRTSVLKGTEKHRDVFAWTVRSDLDYRLARCAGVSNLIVAEPKRMLGRFSWNVGSLLEEES